MIFTNDFAPWMVGLAILPHSLFVIIYLIFKEKIGFHDRIAAFIVFILMLIPARQIAFHYADHENLNLFVRIYGYHLITSPLLYYYCKSLVIPSFQIKKIDLLHAMPFFLFSMYFIFLQSKASDDGYHTLIMNPTKEPTSTGKFVGLLSFTILILYSIKIIKLVKYHKSNIKDYLSQITENQTLSWLYWIIASFYGTIILTITSGILTRLTNMGFLNMTISLEIFNTLFWTIYTLLIYILSFFFIRQTRILPETSETQKVQISNNGFEDEINETKDSIKYKKSGLTEESKLNIHKTLKDIMDRKKPYLDEDLNLNKLAKLLYVRSNHLSQVINEVENVSFFHYVNEWRVREAMRLIQEDISNEKKLIEIAYDSGFNSLSSFNLHFKRVSGFTPREFRNKLSKDSSSFGNSSNW
ncbi:MAG: helix-turn-helix transcriptional regulator [Leptospira sp.]|nr:helix-turn-helix transcriptional regulator [Leptospira sp.]